MSSRSWRGTILFAGILIVLGLTVGLRLYTGGQLDLLTASAPDSAAHATPPAHSSSSPVPAPTRAANTSGAPPVSAGSPPTATSTGSANTSGAPSAGAGSPPAATPTRLDGDIEQTPFGNVQVQVTFAGSTMTKVAEIQSPHDENRSEEINSLAEPVLEREALSSQSATIDTVSGATYTSEGYKRSLQSALDKR